MGLRGNIAGGMCLCSDSHRHMYRHFQGARRDYQDCSLCGSWQSPSIELSREGSSVCKSDARFCRVSMLIPCLKPEAASGAPLLISLHLWRAQNFQMLVIAKNATLVHTASISASIAHHHQSLCASSICAQVSAEASMACDP